MTGWLHDVARQVRVLGRNVRVSRRLRGRAGLAARRAALEAVYRTTNAWLASLGVEYWLVYGTLLGYHREGGVLEGDHDVDFGVHEREYARVWAARGRLPPGYRVYDTSRRHHGPKLYVVHRGWEADLYFFRDADDHLQSWEKSDFRGYTSPFPKTLVYPLRTTAFLGEPTTVPADTEGYLRHVYGYIGRDAVRDRVTGYWQRKAT